MRDEPHGRRRRRPSDPRRRPSDGFRAPSLQAFGRLVDAAVRTIPPQLLGYLRNVEILVEEVPPADPVGEGDEVLLGLYRGVPAPERGGVAPVLPDVITLYRRPIELRCRDAEELRELVRTTVVHEIAHHFGLDDDHLDDLGY